jgi:hypothetical protein
MRKVMNGIVVAMLAVPALVFGQGGDVNKVLADMKAALGGADKVAGVKSMTAVGRSLRTSPTGNTTENEFELAMELPNKYMMRSVLANLGNMSVYRNAGFNGDALINVIDQPPSLGGGGGMVMVRAAGTGGPGGAAPTPEQQAESNRRLLMTQKHDFARLTLGLFGSSYDGFPVQFSYAGEAEAADGKAFVIDVKGEGDFAGRLFVDSTTHLPLMFSWMAPEPLVMTQTMRGGGPGGGGGQTVQMGGGATFTTGGGNAGGRQMTEEEQKKAMADAEEARRQAEANRKTVEYRVFYSDYKTVSGVKLPHTIRRSVDGKPTEEMTFESIKLNPKIDAKKFEVSK